MEDGQHDQDASPGYMGPEGIPSGPPPRESGVGEVIEQVVADFGGAEMREAAENTPSIVPSDLDELERRDTGMGVADVDSGPYAGSAGSRALELAEEDQPGDTP